MTDSIQSKIPDDAVADVLVEQDMELEFHLREVQREDAFEVGLEAHDRVHLHGFCADLLAELQEVRIAAPVAVDRPVDPGRLLPGLVAHLPRKLDIGDAEDPSFCIAAEGARSP